MKKIFLAKRNALLTSASASWGAFALAFAIVVLAVRLVAPNVFWYGATPFLRAGNALAEESHTFIAGFGNTAALTIKNEELANENTALANENAALIKKMESLSALLGSSPTVRNAGAGILASISARPPLSPYDTLLVSAGSEEGVTLGMEAFGPPAGEASMGGIPLGVVSSVVSHYSRVTLFSAPRMTLGGWVGRANVPLLIHGEGGGALSASVARSAPIAVSDTVYAPGPGQLPIGSVLRIDNDPSSPSVTLHIQPAFNLFSLGWVLLRDTGITLP